MSRLYTLFSWLVFFVCIPSLTLAHTILVSAGKKECFFEDLHVNDQMTVSYQVSGGGHLDVDFWLQDPAGTVLGKQIKQSTGQVAITVEHDGRHEYCFSNQMSAIADKMVSFNVHGIIFVAGNDAVEPIDREIRKFAAGLGALKDEQEYMMLRERTHRNTAESTNSRVKWWSILQAVVLFSVVAWQVWYLKSFFEVKRVI